MVVRNEDMEKRFGEYLNAIKPKDLGEQMYGQPFAGSGLLEDDLIECIYRGTGSNRDMDEEVHEVLDSPGMYADMAWEVMKYLILRGVRLD